MPTLAERPHLPTPITAHIARAGEESALERLWTCFRHDMSAVTGELPNSTGGFRTERLRNGLTDPAWSTWILHAADHPIGLAVVRGLDGHERVLNSFFVAAGARRSGLGWSSPRPLCAQRRGVGRWPTRTPTRLRRSSGRV